MADTLEVVQTAEFAKWLRGLKDSVGRGAVLSRLTRLRQGNWGDHAAVGGEVTELRIHFGPGYRVYCWKDGNTTVVVLGGVAKNGQQADIDAAKAAVEELKKE